MHNLFEVHPEKPISGILPNQKRISDVMQLPLSRAEFLRCMHSGTVYAVVGNEKLIVTSMDYDKALALFDKPVQETLNSSTLVQLKESINTESFAEKLKKAEERIVVSKPEPLPVKVVEEKQQEKEEPAVEEVKEPIITNNEEEKKEPTEKVEDKKQITTQVSVASKKKNKHN